MPNSALLKLGSQMHVVREGDVHLLSPQLAAVEVPQTQAVVCRPWPSATTVLNLAKAHVYHTFYERLRVLWPGCRLLYTDTDSAYLEVQSEDPYADMAARPEWFNSTTMGALKDECGGRVIEEFIGLRSKAYSVLMADGCTKARAAGITAGAVDLATGSSALEHELYRQALFHSAEQTASASVLGQSTAAVCASWIMFP